MVFLTVAFFALCLFALLGVLGFGLFSMARGGEFSLKYSNKIMRMRVLIQALALLFFVILLSLLK